MKIVLPFLFALFLQNREREREKRECVREIETLLALFPYCAGVYVCVCVFVCVAQLFDKDTPILL